MSDAPQIGEVRTHPDGKTYAWNGQGWVAVVWDGAKWVRPPDRNRSVKWIVGGVVALVVVGLIAVGVATAGPTDPNASRGVTEVHWTGSQVTFWYHADKACTVAFHYAFVNEQGEVIDQSNGEERHETTAGHKYHVTATADNWSIPPPTTRIDVTPRCT